MTLKKPDRSMLVGKPVPTEMRFARCPPFAVLVGLAPPYRLLLFGKCQIIGINVSRDIVFGWFEKKFDFLRDFADCSHNTCILTKAGHKKTIKNCQITASADIA